jgi:predicted RNase H-like nuclease (RuvC/YqgF family)
MTEVNCQFRKRIKNLSKELKGFKKKRKELEDKYSNLRKEVFKLK